MTTASALAPAAPADTAMQRVAAGLSLLFAPGDRIDGVALSAALERCQARAHVGHDANGSLDVIVGGLSFEMDGLAPYPPLEAAPPADRHGFETGAGFDGLQAVRLFPGHHLSGGTRLAQVYRALLALAAELCAQVPARAVHWHPAHTLIAPDRFTRSTLAWLAGGVFPTPELVAIQSLGEDHVTSRGLAHFIGQEVLVTGSARITAERLAALVIDHFVQAGPLAAYASLTLAGVAVDVEPAKAARQILAWAVD